MMREMSYVSFEVFWHYPASGDLVARFLTKGADAVQRLDQEVWRVILAPRSEEDARWLDETPGMTMRMELLLRRTAEGWEAKSCQFGGSEDTDGWFPFPAAEQHGRTLWVSEEDGELMVIVGTKAGS